MDERKTLAWDVDDVLNDLMGAWLAAFCRKQGRVGLDETNLTANPPHELLGLSLTHYLADLDRFRQADYDSLLPRPEVLTWFEQHGSSYRHLAVTAVPLTAASCSAAWVLRHFGRWIRTFHVVPSPRPNHPAPVYDGSKAEFFRWLSKVDLFVDDQPENVAAARTAGVPSLLWPRPWNDNSNTPVDALRIIPDLLGSLPQSSERSTPQP